MSKGLSKNDAANMVAAIKKLQFELESEKRKSADLDERRKTMAELFGQEKRKNAELEDEIRGCGNHLKPPHNCENWKLRCQAAEEVALEYFMFGSNVLPSVRREKCREMIERRLAELKKEQK